MLTRCCVAFALFSSLLCAQSTGEAFRRFLDNAFEELLKDNPTLANSFGRQANAGQWTDLSPAARASRKARSVRWHSELKRFDRTQLNETDRLYYDWFSYQVDRLVEAGRYPNEVLAIDPLFTGPHISVPARLQRQPARSVADYEQLLALLRAVPVYVEQHIALLQEGLREGITAPQIILRDLPAQIDTLIVGAPQKSQFMAAFQRFPSSISEADRQALTKEAAALVDGGVFPVFRKLRDFLANDYIPRSRTTISRSALPNGPAWYALNVREYTTTTLSAREIHELGLREVKRIRAQMDTIREETGFRGNHAEFLTFLRTAPQFYYTKPEDLLTSFRDLCKRIDPELPRLFRTLPRTPYGVIPTPDHIAPSDTTARYIRSSADGLRPGYFQVNTYKLDSRPKYEMEALALHEAVPGHHLQLALALEREETPAILRIGGTTA
jgi:uncharacterized protein (DUF885 family)